MEKNTKQKNISIICISIVLIILIITGAILLNTKIKENEDTKQIQLKLDAERKNETDRRIKLDNCISSAKNSRSKLWDSNCVKQKNGSCTISDMSTINWIEERYQSDLNNCYKLYN